MNNNVYTAVADGTNVKVFNALNGIHIMTRNIGYQILTCVCAGDVLSVTVQMSPHTRYAYTYKLPHFNQISAYSL